MYMSETKRNEIAALIKGYALMDRFYLAELHKEAEDLDHEAIEVWQRLRQREIDKLAELGINL